MKKYGVVLMVALLIFASCNKQDRDEVILPEQKVEEAVKEVLATIEEEADPLNESDVEGINEAPLWQVAGMVDGKGEPYQSPEANRRTGVQHNVLDYGALPNDENFDNVDAIMAAIEAATYGDEVYLPEGTYWLKKSSLYSKSYIAHIKLKEGVNLSGDGMEKTVLMSDFPASDNEKKQTTVLLAKGQNDIVIRDLAVTSNTSVESMPDPDDQNTNNLALTAPVNGIAIDSESPLKQYGNILIERVLIEKFQRMGIRVRTVRDVRIKSCTIQNATDLGRGGAGYAIAIQGTKNGIDITDSNLDTVHNVVEDCQLIGPYLRHGVIIQYFAHNNLIRNNYIEGTLLDSIDLHGEDEYANVISGNKIVGSRKGAGIGIGNSGATHDAAGPDNLIYDNVLEGCLRGIDILYGTAGTKLIGNTIRDINADNGTGIFLKDAHETVIEDNLIEGMKGAESQAIKVLYAYDALEPQAGVPRALTIRNNKIMDVENGIYVETHNDKFIYEGNQFEKVLGTDYQNDHDVFALPEISDVVIPREGTLLYPTDDNFISNESRTSVQMQVNMKFKSTYSEVPYNRMVYIRFDIFEAPSELDKVYLKFSAKSKEGLMSFNIYGTTTYTDWDERGIHWENAPYHEDAVAKVKDDNNELTLVSDFTFPSAGDDFNTYYVDVTEYVQSVEGNVFTFILANDEVQEMYGEIYSKDVSQEGYKLGLVFTE